MCLRLQLALGLIDSNCRDGYSKQAVASLSFCRMKIVASTFVTCVKVQCGMQDKQLFFKAVCAGDASSVQSMLGTLEMTPDICSPHKVSNSMLTKHGVML